MSSTGAAGSGCSGVGCLAVFLLAAFAAGILLLGHHDGRVVMVLRSAPTHVRELIAGGRQATTETHRQGRRGERGRAGAGGREGRSGTRREGQAGRPESGARPGERRRLRARGHTRDDATRPSPARAEAAPGGRRSTGRRHGTWVGSPVHAPSPRGAPRAGRNRGGGAGGGRLTPGPATPWQGRRHGAGTRAGCGSSRNGWDSTGPIHHASNFQLHLAAAWHGDFLRLNSYYNSTPVRDG